MRKAEYKLTITATIEFEYYPYKKSGSSDYEYYVDYEDYETFNEDMEVELIITPDILIKCLEYIYADSKTEIGIDEQKQTIINSLQIAPYFFQKICAEIFTDENLDCFSKVYEYLVITEEFKNKEKAIIKDECRTLGEPCQCLD